MKPITYVSGIAYSLGHKGTLEDLKAEEGLEDNLVALLRQLGFSNFYSDSRDTAEMCFDTLERTLASAQMHINDIGAVLTLNGSRDGGVVDEAGVLRALHRIGFRKIPVMSIGMQYCAGFCGILKIASDLASTWNRNILVLTLGRVRPGQSRLGIQSNYLFSDGAASCVVSPDRGTLEIVQTEAGSNLELALLKPSPATFQERSIRILDDLREIFGKTISGAQINPAQLRVFFGLNMSLVALQVLGDVAKVDKTKVYLTNTEKFAHVFTCDHLLNLKTYDESSPLRTGDHVMLAGWHLHTVSSAILRVV